MKSTWLQVSFALALGVSAVACGKKDASSTDAPAASASAAVAAVPTVAVPTVAMPTATVEKANPADGASIAACCAGLRAAEGTAKASDKGKYESAAATCDGIAGLVRSGRTAKGAAIGQIRAALHGDTLPAACN